MGSSDYQHHSHLTDHTPMWTLPIPASMRTNLINSPPQRSWQSHSLLCLPHKSVSFYSDDLCFHPLLLPLLEFLRHCVICDIALWTCRTLPFFTICSRLWVTIMTVTVLKEAKAEGPSNFLAICFVGTLQKVEILTGCPGFEAYLAALFSCF